MKYSRRLCAGAHARVGASVVGVRPRYVGGPLGCRRHIVQVRCDCVVAGAASGCGASPVRVCLRWCVRVLVLSSCVCLAWVWELVWCCRRCWCDVDVHCSSRGFGALRDIAVDGVRGREELVVQARRCTASFVSVLKSLAKSRIHLNCVSSLDGRGATPSGLVYLYCAISCDCGRGGGLGFADT